MVPDLIWASDFFGPQEIWFPRNLVPEKFGPCMKKPYNDFHAGTKFLGSIFRRDQTSWGKISRGQTKLGAQMRLGTISVRAIYNTQKKRLFTQIVVSAWLITYFGNFDFRFFCHFGCVIFYTLNFRFAHLALQNAYLKQSK